LARELSVRLWKKYWHEVPGKIWWFYYWHVSCPCGCDRNMGTRCRENMKMGWDSYYIQNIYLKELYSKDMYLKELYLNDIYFKKIYSKYIYWKWLLWWPKRSSYVLELESALLNLKNLIFTLLDLHAQSGKVSGKLLCWKLMKIRIFALKVDFSWL